MVENSPALDVHLLQTSLHQNAYCGGRVLMLQTILFGLIFSVILNTLSWTSAGAYYMQTQKLTITMASSHMQPARHMQLERVRRTNPMQLLLPAKAQQMRQSTSVFSASGSGDRSHIQVVASDVDGTLLNSHGLLSPRTAAAIRQVRAAGVSFIIATGKSRTATLDAFGASDESMALELANLPGVFNGGVQVFQSGGRLAWQALLDLATVKAVEQWAAKSGEFDLVAFSGNRLLTTKRTSRTDELHLVYHEQTPEVCQSLEAMAAPVITTLETSTVASQEGSDVMGINNILVLGDPERLIAVRTALMSVLASSGASLSMPVPNMFVVLPAGCSKGDGLRRLLELEGLAGELLMSMGDAENDLAMLQMSATGVAMGNAVGPAVVAAARGLQTRRNDENGAALALEALLDVGFSKADFEEAVKKGL